jgi:hypothetical protein
MSFPESRHSVKSGQFEPSKAGLNEILGWLEQFPSKSEKRFEHDSLGWLRVTVSWDEEFDPHPMPGAQVPANMCYECGAFLEGASYDHDPTCSKFPVRPGSSEA